ncbi:MAG: type II toxin-antitoxin system Phd/YefM family antitoxin [Deltaproteobacteria bacterium]|nr:type II toxin-antitoxin system Phd/YefM family antitoxin [Deltaproteobacteria bacterium]
MHFISVRDFRQKSGKIWKFLNKEKELIITSNGKPIALVTPISEANLEESLLSLRRSQALMAMEQMQNQSVEKGYDKMTIDNIDAEIQKVRQQRKNLK